VVDGYLVEKTTEYYQRARMNRATNAGTMAGQYFSQYRYRGNARCGNASDWRKNTLFAIKACLKNLRTGKKLLWQLRIVYAACRDAVCCNVATPCGAARADKLSVLQTHKANCWENCGRRQRKMKLKRIKGTDGKKRTVPDERKPRPPILRAPGPLEAIVERRCSKCETNRRRP